MTAARALQLEGLSMSYPVRDSDRMLDVLNDVSFSVGSQETYCVAGRSGSGKTTLLTIAAGLLRPSSGRVSWLGDDISTLGAEAVARLRRERVGVVFQSGGLIGSLTAEENVALPGMVDARADPRRRARELLGLVGLADRGRHFPSELSGGEQQRVALARALFRDPPVLLVDEPTANLDRATANSIIDVLTDIAASGKAVLVASHDPVLIDRATTVLRID